MAVITRFPSIRHLVMIFFCIAGSSSNGISTPMSPRATIIPSHSLLISSILSTPERFSIFAMRSMPSAPISFRYALISSKSCLQETNEQAIKSTSCSAPNLMSCLSCSLKYFCLSVLFGKLMLFLSESSPPIFTRQIISVSVLSVTSKDKRPLLRRIISPFSRSCGSPL